MHFIIGGVFNNYCVYIKNMAMGWFCGLFVYIALKSMNRGKLIYLTDLLLVPVFVVSLGTGLWLHAEGHVGRHAAGLETCHIIAGVLFVLLAAVHVWCHWKWYRNLFSTMSGRKVALSLFSVAALALVVSGIVSWIGCFGEHLCLLHYQAGIVAGIMGIVHILKRRRFLVSGFALHVLGRKRA